MAVSLSIANHDASLPHCLAALPARGLVQGSRAAAQGQGAGDDRLPDQARDRFGANADGLCCGRAKGVVLMDAGYGSDTRSRTAISALGLLCR